MNYLFVFIGGGFGALLRYLYTSLINPKTAAFPLGTLFVNSIGAFIIGIAINFFDAHEAQKIKLFFITGFLGGFTTFSTYSLETAKYLTEGSVKKALLNILLNNVICILFVFFGMHVSKN